MSEIENITLLLDEVEAGDRDAGDRLFALVYDELRQLANGQMGSESVDHTLQSTALVHEAWLKLIGSKTAPVWKNRGHFFAAASKAMRRILVDAARRRQRTKRGGNNLQEELQDSDGSYDKDCRLVELDEALTELESADPVKAELVNLRYFGGCTNRQAAEQLGISVATAERHWTFARAWLRAHLEKS